MVRGLDVLELLPSEYLSVNEIEAAKLAFPKHGPKNIFNPQQQTEMTWPINSTLALAYLDQVKREGSIDSNNEKILRSSLIGLESRTGAENHKILSIIFYSIIYMHSFSIVSMTLNQANMFRPSYII